MNEIEIVFWVGNVGHEETALMVEQLTTRVGVQLTAIHREPIAKRVMGQVVFRAVIISLLILPPNSIFSHQAQLNFGNVRQQKSAIKRYGQQVTISTVLT